MRGEPMRINIVEPTLSSEAGHCHSFVESVCAARREGDGDITVYAGSRARLPRIEGMGVRVVPYFHRRIRRPEAFLLYRKLLREPGRIFVPTAGRADLTLLSLAAGRSIPPGKAFLYFHWVKPDPSKREFFRRASPAAAGPHPDGTDGDGCGRLPGVRLPGRAGRSVPGVARSAGAAGSRKGCSGTCCTPARRGGTKGSRRLWISCVF